MSNEPIFGRIESAIAGFDPPQDRGPNRLFLGATEWDQLVALCQKWDFGWPPGTPDYEPEVKRAQFKGLVIYRVDAVFFLEVY
jgi:hypothetical protein